MLLAPATPTFPWNTAGSPAIEGLDVGESTGQWHVGQEGTTANWLSVGVDSWNSLAANSDSS